MTFQNEEHSNHMRRTHCKLRAGFLWVKLPQSKKTVDVGQSTQGMKGRQGGARGGGKQMLYSKTVALPGAEALPCLAFLS